MGRAVLVCSCDRDGLCPACAEREAAEWEPDPRQVAEAEAQAWEQRALRAEYELGHIGGAP